MEAKEGVMTLFRTGIKKDGGQKRYEIEDRVEISDKGDHSNCYT